ncbi:MAG: RES family NAD+ phosphorylase [Gemmatimonadota bacterium]
MDQEPERSAGWPDAARSPAGRALRTRALAGERARTNGVRLPSPPEEPPRRKPRFVDLPADTLLVRFYNPDHGRWQEGRTHGPSPRGRFDHHPLPPVREDPHRSVWYAARNLVCAVAEAFGDDRHIDRASNRRVVLARVQQPLILLSLLGTAPRHFGLDQRIATTTDYRTTQAWARAFYGWYDDFAGMEWRGRQAGSVCVVLNDRADMSRLSLDADHPIGNPAIWPRIARAARQGSIGVI